MRSEFWTSEIRILSNLDRSGGIDISLKISGFGITTSFSLLLAGRIKCEIVNRPREQSAANSIMYHSRDKFKKQITVLEISGVYREMFYMTARQFPGICH